MDKQLFQYKGSIPLMLILAMMTIAQGVVIIFQAIYLADAIVSMYEKQPWNTTLHSFTLFLLMHLGRHLLQWIKSKLAYYFADRTAQHMQSLLIEKLFELGPRAIGKHGSGNLITLCLEGIPSFRTYLELFIPRFIAMLCIPIAILIYVFTLDLASAIVLSVVLPIMIAFLILLGLTAKKQIHSQMGTYLLLSRHFVDSLRGLVTLKFLGRSKGHRESIQTVSNKFRIATMRTLRVAFMSSFSLDFFSTLSVAVVAVELGLRLIEGDMLLAPALTILILAPEYFFPIRDFGNDYHATMDGKEAGKQINRILQQDIMETNTSIKIDTWNESSELVVKNLIKKSPTDERFLLEAINFSVSGYKKIGIVGTTGAGKSTLIDILSGFTQPTDGEIIINHKNVTNFSVENWQQQVTYLPQHPYIFSGTVADNIRFYDPEASLEKTREVAAKVGLLELIDSFPNGLNEKIGQGGRTLSGGEEQRIALARGLLQNRPVIILDEPTAHLDIETEHEIKQVMLPLFNNKLVFFATHRLHWMKSMDIIFVIDKGRLVEIGTHEELFHKKGAYYRLVEAHRGTSKGVPVGGFSNGAV
ncbi:thiol reductant ABC exporter subunit CydD [Bacillus kwashiorkori]|uniref:thiol reductant ABC exporter subunit CydD n=1 Tax=Bacillus kwashiorkori TaxID=1522318 RepID=UPI0007829F68|nr:thiol reductant ABC exporter subunit CydD [Bacillus kwashiorkori]